MTLIEMLITITIMAIIIVPLTTSLYLLLVGTSASSQTISDTSTAHVMSTYFTTDVADSQTVVYGNDSTCPPPSGSGQLAFEWTDPSGSGTSMVAAYVLEDSGTTLHRVVCANGTLTDDTILVTNVVPVAGNLPAPTCSGAACAGNAHPQQITQQITVQAKAQRTDTFYTAYTYSLSGTRRSSP